MTDARLSQIEYKLDRFSEAIISLSRMEERMVSLYKRLDRVDDSFNKFEQIMGELEQTSIKLRQTIAFAERLFCIVLTGAVGSLFVYLR